MAIRIRGGGGAACLAPPPPPPPPRRRRIRGGAAAAYLVAPPPSPPPPRRIRGGAAAAYLVAPPPPPPPRIRSGGAVPAAAATTGTRGPILLRSVRRALRCAPDPPREEEGNGAAWEALKAMVADVFGPLLRNLADIQSLRSVYDLEDYHLGMIFGAVLACVGCYQLWKAAPSVFINVVLAYAFYILSVASAEVRRQGKRNDLFTRLKFGIVVIMAIKEFRKDYGALDILRMPVFTLYLATFLFDITCLKKYAKHYLILTVNLLKTKGGFQELFRILFYPGYISPHDDCFHRERHCSGVSGGSKDIRPL